MKENLFCFFFREEMADICGRKLGVDKITVYLYTFVLITPEWEAHCVSIRSCGRDGKQFTHNGNQADTLSTSCIHNLHNLWQLH